MGRRIAKYFVGLSDQAVKSNKWNALRSGSGFEVVIPLEVGLPIIWTEAYDISRNEEILARDLDLIDEQRENGLIWMTNYQKQLAKTYNK